MRTEKKKPETNEQVNKVYQKSKPVSSHREFFQRLYGNLETSYEISSQKSIEKVDQAAEISNLNAVKPVGKVIGATEKFHFQQSPEYEKQTGSRDKFIPTEAQTKTDEYNLKKRESDTELNPTASPYYNLQFCQQTLQVSMRPFYSAIQIDPLSIGFSAFFLNYKNNQNVMHLVKFSSHFWVYLVYSMHLLCSGTDIPNFGLLDIRVGNITHVRKHAAGHPLYEQVVDFGEQSPKTIISSLEPCLVWDDLFEHLVLYVVNLKRIKLKGVESHGMVLCVCKDRTVDLLIPPEGSVPGDVVRVEGYDYKPEPSITFDIYDSIEAYLNVNDDRVVTFNNIPWNVSGKGVVTTRSLKNHSFKSKPTTKMPTTTVDPNILEI